MCDYKPECKAVNRYWILTNRPIFNPETGEKWAPKQATTCGRHLSEAVDELTWVNYEAGHGRPSALDGVIVRRWRDGKWM